LRHSVLSVAGFAPVSFGAEMVRLLSCYILLMLSLSHTVPIFHPVTVWPRL